MIKVRRTAYTVSMPSIYQKLVGIVLTQEATKKELTLNFLLPKNSWRLRFSSLRKQIFMQFFLSHCKLS